MKKLLIGLTLVSVASLAMADGRGGGHGGYHNTGGGWVTPLIIGGSIGYILGRPQPQPQVVIQQPPQVIYQQNPQTVYVYPPSAPVIQTQGMYCELHSEVVNGQVVTGNFCYQR